MLKKINLKKSSFLIYGLGTTGQSVIRFFKKKKINNFFKWDDNTNLRKKFNIKKTIKINQIIIDVDFVVLSPGISLKKSIYKKELIKNKKKIITDIDIFYLTNLNFKSIVVTGTNGKSTTCKIISHLLKKNNFNVQLGGNIGTPILDLKIKKNNFIVIEASSFQLSHSKFLKPDYAILLNISNDHIDWHGSMNNYKNSKYNIFKLQEKNSCALINRKLKKGFIQKNFKSKIFELQKKKYYKIKSSIQNDYLVSKVNDENMCFVYTLSKLLKINDKNFIKTMKSFKGLPHRHEIFFKRKNLTIINDSKATSFQAAKFALINNNNIFWILGGLPKINDKITLKNVKKNVFKAYIIGKHASFFKKQLRGKINFQITKNIKYSLLKIFADLKYFQKDKITILFSPAAASFDQYKNFEIRGNEFKKYSKAYAKYFI